MRGRREWGVEGMGRGGEGRREWGVEGRAYRW